MFLKMTITIELINLILYLKNLFINIIIRKYLSFVIQFVFFLQIRSKRLL